MLNEERTKWQMSLEIIVYVSNRKPRRSESCTTMTLNISSKFPKFRLTKFGLFNAFES